MINLRIGKGGLDLLASVVARANDLMSSAVIAALRKDANGTTRISGSHLLLRRCQGHSGPQICVCPESRTDL